MQSQQLPTESQVFEDEVLPRTEGADHPAEEMSERRDHSKNLSGKARIELCAKSIHFKGVRRFGEGHLCARKLVAYHQTGSGTLAL